MDLTDKNIIVTGGASGLGRILASSLVQQKSNVIVFDINSSQLADLAESNCHVDPVLCDATDPHQVFQKVNDVYEKYGHIDGLVNNAGLIYNEPLINLLSSNRIHSIEGWEKTIRVNLTSAFLMTSHVVDKMIASRTKGVVVNISSISSKGNPGQSAYSAAKAGINALTATWSKEFGAFGIRVVAVSPGFINTESTHIALNESMILELSKEIPLGRLGNTSDIAKSVIYAFECDYLNGKILEIDGGLVM